MTTRGAKTRKRGYRGGETVEPGIYLDVRELRFRSMDEEGRLPGGETTRWRRVPAVVMLLAAPVISVAYFVFLPMVGFLMLAGVVGLKLHRLGKQLAIAMVPMLRPAWQPARAFLSRGKRAGRRPGEKTEEAPAEDAWAEEARRDADDPGDAPS
ncbi:MAG: hypothetical protein ACLF0P_03405 [Thermoanaerobaculia bacterium]